MATTVHLVRHAHTDALGVCLAGRAAGWPLNSEGRAAAERLADGTAHLHLHAIIASPSQRAQQTAACIASRAGMAIATDPAFDEIDFGDWTGRGFADLHADPGWQHWNRHRGLTQPPQGETMLHAQARAMAGLCALGEAWPDGALVVVSHADIVKAILAAVLGLSLDLMQRLVVDPASRSIVRLSATTAEIVAVNLPAGG